MREVPIKLPDFGTDKPYLVNLPNANADDMAVQFVFFCEKRIILISAKYL